MLFAKVSDMQASLRDEWSFEPRPQKARELRRLLFLTDEMDMGIVYKSQVNLSVPLEGTWGVSTKHKLL